MKTSADQIAEGRKATGLTVREIAYILSVSPQIISFAENKNLKRKMVSENMIRKICIYYGLETENIILQYQAEQKELKARNKAARKAAKEWQYLLKNSFNQCLFYRELIFHGMEMLLVYKYYFFSGPLI